IGALADRRAGRRGRAGGTAPAAQLDRGRDPGRVRGRGAAATPAVVGRPGRARVAVRVLLVEDDEGIRSVLAELVADRGHEVVEHTHAARAWAEFEREPFPLAIVDWMLPGAIDGLELCRPIRASAASARTSILGTTAS